MKGNWVNVFDPWDFFVAGAPIKKEFLNDGLESIVEEEVINSGLDGFTRHGIKRYLAQKKVQRRLADLLNINRAYT